MKGRALALAVGLSMLSATSVMAEEPVYFADGRLKAAVESALGISDPTPTDLLSLTDLSANSSGIVDLMGIEHATNLMTLRLYDNQISDISSLSGLIHLTVLWLSSNRISDISALSGLTNLTVLWLNDNQISDVSALSGLIHLTSLELNDNQVSDISALSGLLHLGSLELYNNQVSDISPLSELIHLSWLWLNYNQISDISPLSGLTNLSTLALIRNQINDISALSELTSLSILHLDTNPLNRAAYCIYLVSIEDNNPGIVLSYDPNPHPPEVCLDDDVPENEDNCPLLPNGPLMGTCTQLISDNYIVSNGQYCTKDTDCDPGEYCEKSQADNYPPGGNSIGDACDCECDFDCSGGVDADDVTAFLGDFGRSRYNEPCSGQYPCSGDVDCNGAVDADDVIKLVEDFGRSQYNNPCPGCVPGQWCSYP